MQLASLVLCQMQSKAEKTEMFFNFFICSCQVQISNGNVIPRSVFLSKHNQVKYLAMKMGSDVHILKLWQIVCCI